MFGTTFRQAARRSAARVAAREFLATGDGRWMALFSGHMATQHSPARAVVLGLRLLAARLALVAK